MPSHLSPARARLGEMLVRRRIELNPGYRNRRVFVAERAPGLYRIVNDIELGRWGKRAGFEPGTIAALEDAYALEAGAIKRALDGGDLAPLDTAPPPAIVPTGIRVIDEAVTGEDLEPFIRQIRREIADAVIEYGPGATGEQIFGAQTFEAENWDSKRLPPDATVQLLAVFRSFAHRDVGGEGESKTGLALVSVPAGSP